MIGTRFVTATVLFGVTVSAGAEPVSQPPKWKSDRKNPYSTLFAPPKPLAFPAQRPSPPAVETQPTCEAAITPESAAIDARLAKQLKESNTRFTIRAVRPNCR